MSEDRKKLVDPVSVSLGVGAWFVLKAAIQAIIGWTVIGSVKRTCRWFRRRKEGDVDRGRADTGVPPKE